MTLKFGTDGVRGPADELTDDLVRNLGRAAGEVLGGERFVLGRDPRLSGPRIAAALAAGLAEAGAEPLPLGVVPTPVTAFAASRLEAPGAVISASHNPFGDNGIKFFAAGGLKLTDAVEAELEARLDELVAGTAGVADPIPPLGEPPEAARSLIDDYLDHLVGSVAGRELDTLSVVIDCANGAASTLAPELLRRLGARLTVLHATPDGTNINASCGSTFPADLQQAVRQARADVGLAFDGDADRLIAVDEQGELVDGDHLLAMCAIDRRDRGVLTDDTLVITVMSNLGLRRSMADHAIKVLETDVGDRNVLEALEERGLVLGGEQSGHLIFRDLATTGDGLLSGLQVLDLMNRTGRFLSDLAASAMEVRPQVLRNVAVARRDPDIARTIADDIAVVVSELGDDGRVLVRPSGTEPLVRVMVEAPTPALANAVAERLVAAVVAACGEVG